MSDAWVKKYRWVRTWGDETGLDGKPHEDYAAYDGEQYAGRIRLDRESLKKGMWQWSGAYPEPMRGVIPIMPNGGFAPTAADAARIVEMWVSLKSAG